MKEFKISDLVEIMKKIKYGYVDKSGLRRTDTDKEFSSLYMLQSPTELTKSKLGVCWDQVELERYFFEQAMVKCETFFIVYYDNDKCPTHTFLIYEENGKFIWFENAWEKYSGIHTFDSLKELLIDVKDRFVTDELIGSIDFDRLCIYKYNKPDYNISCIDFCKHCEEGEKIVV